jgi:hypothetical protein
MFDDANFGYRQGRSTKMPCEGLEGIKAGAEWIVDAYLKDGDAAWTGRLVQFLDCVGAQRFGSHLLPLARNPYLQCLAFYNPKPQLTRISASKSRKSERNARSRHS